MVGDREMIDLTTTLRTTSRTATASAPAPARTVGEPTLITEQQVMFSTAAAVAPAPGKTRRWTDAFASVAGAVQTFFADSREPAQRHQPKRYAYLENALMGREMQRL
jgi:hypothetical protein